MPNEPSNDDLMHAVTDLAGAVHQGFARVESRLGNLETRATSIEGEIKGIHQWMARADERFDNLEPRFA